MRRNRTISGATVLAIGSWVQPALASKALPAGLSVGWQAPSACPDAAQVNSAVASMLGESTGPRGASDLVTSGTVTEVEGRFHLQIRLDSSGAAEDKSMDADACATLADAYALIVAYTFNPSLASPPLVAPSARPPPHAVAALAPSEARAAEGPSLHFAGGPLAALGVGALPSLAYGFGARIALETGPRWELAGMFWPEQSTTVVVGPSLAAGAGVWLADAEPSACLPLVGGAIAPCIGGELGAMRAHGTGVATPGTGMSWWLAVTAGISLRVALSPRASLRFRLDVGVPLFLPSFELDDVGSQATVRAFRPAQAFGAFSLEPEFQLFSTNRRATGHVSP